MSATLDAAAVLTQSQYLLARVDAGYMSPAEALAELAELRDRIQEAD